MIFRLLLAVLFLAFVPAPAWAQAPVRINPNAEPRDRTRTQPAPVYEIKGAASQGKSPPLSNALQPPEPVLDPQAMPPRQPEPAVPLQPPVRVTVIPAAAPVPHEPAASKNNGFRDPFFEDEEQVAQQVLHKQAQVALSRCKLLARGMSSSKRTTALLAINAGQRVMVSAGDRLVLPVTDGREQQPSPYAQQQLFAGGASPSGMPVPQAAPAWPPPTPAVSTVQLEVISISRQGIEFKLPDGTSLFL